MTRVFGERSSVRRWIFIGVLACVLVVSGGMVANDGDYFLKVNKSIDVFGRVYKEITAKYVDEVDPEKFMQAGIDGMLGTLDPYTVYIDRSESDEVDLLTNGKYGGIGVTIGVRDGALQVISVMDGYSAARAGMQPGDRIIQVDSMKVGAKKPEEVRTVTRGEPGTEVKVIIEREGEPKPIEFVLIREDIQIKNVTYADMIGDGVGYIRLERFSRKAGDEVRQAIKQLEVKGPIKGMVLDLRGNPGGLLDAAVDVVSKFLPRGSAVVSTKGRLSESEKVYRSDEEPLLPDVPLIVLTDRGSASASEIVSGAIQDLDRGLIVGTRTFGKGLVQTILPLNYGAQLKITTARYYTPSGRSIQEIDYLHKDRNGVFATVPDSLRREFKTRGGRSVSEYGGIAPDSVIKAEEFGPMIRELYRKSLFFKFSNKYIAEHKDAQYDGINDAILNEFRDFLKTQKFDYQEDSENKITELREIAEQSHYNKDVLKDLELLSVALGKEKDRAFDRYEDHIARELNIELMARVDGEHGRIKASLEGDPQLEGAKAILTNKKIYEEKLQG